MTTKCQYHSKQAVTAQAPALVSVASKIGPPQACLWPTSTNLKLAVSRYDLATVGPITGREVLVSFEDQLGSVIEYADIPHEDLAYVFRAVDALREYLDRPKDLAGVDIAIEKRIPFDTYLGGRAATAAAVLVGLAGLWEASIAREDMARLAQCIGDGVAQAIIGGAVISSAGAHEETMTSILSQGEIAMVLVPAAADLADAEFFQTLQAILPAKNDPTDDESAIEFDQQLVEAVSRGDSKQLALMMHNDFQPALVRLLPEHNDWLTAGMQEGALAAQTVDRGPSLMFVAETLDAAHQLAERYEQRMGISAIAEYGPVPGARLL